MTRGGIVAAALTAGGMFLSPRLDAHRLDEYLQATRLSVALDRIELEIDLTPGVSIAERIVTAIDTDRDGRFSPAESDAYAAHGVERVGADRRRARAAAEPR